MAQEKHKKYIISKPKLVYDLPHHATGEVRGFTYPYQVYADSEFLEGSPAFIEMGWRTEIPQPNPIMPPHTHPFDQILVYKGYNLDDPQDLCGELEIQLDDERYRIDTTSVIFIPKGVTHAVRHIRVDRPIFFMAAGLTMGTYIAEEAKQMGQTAQEKYRKYIVSKPKLIYDMKYHFSEVRGRTYPYYVWLGAEVADWCPVFIDGFGWNGWSKELQSIVMPSPNPIVEPHKHDKFGHFMIFVGSDPSNPQDLYAEYTLQLDDESYRLDRTTVIWVPKGVTHTYEILRIDRPTTGGGIAFASEYS